MLFLYFQFKNNQLGQNDRIVKYVLFSPGSILSNPSVPSSRLFIKVGLNTSFYISQKAESLELQR